MDIFLRTDNRLCCRPVDAIAMVLYRFSFPTRLRDMVKVFGRSRSAISRFVKKAISFLDGRYADLLAYHPALKNQQNLERFSRICQNKGSVYEHCFGFIDVTLRMLFSFLMQKQ